MGALERDPNLPGTPRERNSGVGHARSAGSNKGVRHRELPDTVVYDGGVKSRCRWTLSLLAAAPYQLLEVHAYVGIDPVPTTNDGSVSPGQFPYAIEFDEPSDSWQLSIPLDELAVGCGEQLNVAVHAVAVAFEDGVEVFEETAWAFGQNEFENHWGWSSDYAICCEE